MPLEGLSFVKSLAAFKLIYATNTTLQNVTKIVRLRWLTFDIFQLLTLLDHAELRFF